MASTGRHWDHPGVRQALALALLILFVSPGVDAGNASDLLASHKALAVRTESASSPALPPSGFVVPSAVSDPLCNGGRGIRLPTGLSTDAVIASGTMASGSTLIATSVLYPDKTFAVLHSLTRACEPDPNFGIDGRVRITIAPDLRPTLWPHSGGLWIVAVGQRKGGGAVIAGSYLGGWLVGEVTLEGNLDSAFGNSGWVVLPFAGEVTAVLQQPSGRILIAGDNGGGGCCNRNWAAALSAHGDLQSTFGKHGRTELPTGSDSGVAGLDVMQNGAILAQVGYGKDGCWGLALEMLTPAGHPVSQFQERLRRFWKTLKRGTFVGDVYANGEGFTLVGTGQGPCYRFRPEPSAAGLTARFRTDGSQIGRTVNFASRMYGGIDAFEGAGDTFVLASPYGDQSQMTVTALRSDGSADSRFGARGRAQIGTPGKGSKRAGDFDVVVTRAGPRAGTLVATFFGDSPMHIVRLRF